MLSEFIRLSGYQVYGLAGADDYGCRDVAWCYV